MPSKYWNVFYGLLSAALLAWPEARAAAPQSAFRKLRADAYRPGRLLLVPAAGHENELSEFSRARGISVQKSYPNLGGSQVVELASGADTMDWLDTYQASGLVAA